MAAQNFEDSLSIFLVCLAAAKLHRARDLRRRQYMADETGLMQFVAQTKALARRLVGENHLCAARQFLQHLNHRLASVSGILERALLRRVASFRILEQHRFVVQITTRQDTIFHGQSSLQNDLENVRLTHPELF